MEQFLPILILLVVVALVIARLPKVDLGHTDAFLKRGLNWLPLGLTYAFCTWALQPQGVQVCF